MMQGKAHEDDVVVFPHYTEPETKWITAPQSRQIKT